MRLYNTRTIELAAGQDAVVKERLEELNTLLIQNQSSVDITIILDDNVDGIKLNNQALFYEYDEVPKNALSVKNNGTESTKIYLEWS